VSSLYSNSQLATLCGLDRRTVSKRLAGVPFTKRGSSHAYKLEDALPALCRRQDAEQETEQKRLTRLQADMVKSKLEERERILLPVSSAMRVWENILIAVKTRILASQLSYDEQCDVLNQLRAIGKDEYFDGLPRE